MSEVPNPAGRARPSGESRPPDRPARPGRMSRLTNWRNWTLPVKLGLVMLVPVLAVLTLGVVVITNQVGQASGYARTDRIVTLSAGVRSAITALQAERLTVAGRDSGIAVARARTDAALADVSGAMANDFGNGDLDPVASVAWSTAQRQLGGLTALRGANGDDLSTTVDAYTVEVDALFAVNRVLATDVADATLARESVALYDLSAAREEVLYQQAVVLAGMLRGTMSVQDVTSLHGSEARLASRISDFHAVASNDDASAFAGTVTGPDLAQQGSLLGQAIDQSGGMTGQVMPGMSIEIPTNTWTSACDAVSGGLAKVMDGLAGELRDSATTLQNQASDTAGTVSVVLAVILVAAAAALALVARQLLRSIRLLRRSARDVAARKLPDAVERIRAGENVDPQVRPVPVDTTDEVGQLARAFDAVHAEALRLAVEQANLRANYGELFMNLSRRSQSLVQRQLRLIEQLERDEEDPDQLSALFKLDHLATRMRRNNENLMVLSGTDVGRGPTQPVLLADLLRAAVSEIEFYQRVLVQPPPDIQVIGYAAGDLIRLIAELLDNATAFSAPESQVTLASHRTRGKSIVVDIVDHGIGMSDEEIARANDQLTQPEGVEEQRISRRMGMFVVSKLANRHGVRVRLHGGQDIPGLRVTVTLPAELIVGAQEAQGIGDDPAVPTQRVALTGPITGPVGDPVTGAMTVTIPKLPSAESSGISLFAPLAGDEAADELPVYTPPPPPEITPIFDDILSAWFSDAPAKHAQPDADGEVQQPAGDSRWTFAADDGWRAVESASAAEPAEFTEVGLPKRQPRARLLPGSVGGETEERSAGMTPERARERLSGFQQGVTRARQRALLPPGQPEPVAPERPNGHAAVNGHAHTNGHKPNGHSLTNGTNGSPPDTNGNTNGHALGGTGLTTSVTEGTVADALLPSGLPKRIPKNHQRSQPREAAAEPPAPPVNDLEDTMVWSALADEGWQAVQAVADQAPAEVTAAGLPKRQPQARLLPGSVTDPASRPALASRDAGAIRDRMSSFQRGVRRGRGGSATVAAEPADAGFHWSEWESETK